MAKMMSAEGVTELLDLLGAADIQVWLDGGWGIDALVGEQTRAHKDLDLIVRHEHVRRMRGVLADRGFEHVRGPDWNFVLRDDAGREIDVHPVRIDEQGSGHLTTEAGKPFLYSADALAAVGTANGRPVQCLSAEAQMVNHSDGDYEPGDTDFHDMRLLSDRLGIRARPPYSPL
jgi:lincosamide nucleotidyltransferase A/C/D/E